MKEESPGTSMASPMLPIVLLSLAIAWSSGAPATDGSQEHTYLPESRPDLCHIYIKSCIKSWYKYVMTSHCMYIVIVILNRNSFIMPSCKHMYQDIKPNDWS